jgi:acetyl esterase/lipase
MDPVSTSDTLIFLALSVPVMIVTAGFRGTIMFYLTAVPFLGFKLPMDLFTNRVMRSYDQRSGFAQKASVYEYAIVSCIEWGVSIADSGGAVTVFFGRQLSLFLYLYRRYRNGGANLGDIQYAFIEPESGVEGVFVNSRHRGDEHDVVLYYVHGGGPAFATIHFYLEFLVTLVRSLQLQGFRNPAIFAIQYPLVPHANFHHQLNAVVCGWNYVASTFESSAIAIVGDSNGGGLALSLMLHIAHPSPDITEVPVRRRPTAAVLMSPWTNLYSAKGSSRADYLTPKVVFRHADRLTAGDRNNVYMSPALCRSREWWRRACPEFGMYLSYGEEEMLADDIQRFADGLCSAGCAASAKCEPHHLHSWQIVQFYLARTPQHRQAGLDDVSANLAKMILWHTATAPATTQTADLDRPLNIY